MANENCLEGIKCPKCGYDESFEVEVTGLVTLTDEGYGYITDGEYDDDSYCRCGNCSHEGKMRDFYLTGDQQD